MTLEELKIIEQVLREPDVHKGMVTYYQAIEYIGREITLKSTDFVTGEATNSANRQAKPENVKCPDCGGDMVSRLNKTSQQRFWGCKKYPECKGTRDTDGRSKAERNKDRDLQREVDEKPLNRKWSV